MFCCCFIVVSYSAHSHTHQLYSQYIDTLFLLLLNVLSFLLYTYYILFTLLLSIYYRYYIVYTLKIVTAV